MNEQKPAFWAILPATVRYDEALPSTAKLLYAEISALQEAKGYCFAQNSYFAKVFAISIRTVQRCLGDLAERGYIQIDTAPDPDITGGVIRMIRVLPYQAETDGEMLPEYGTTEMSGDDESVTEGHDENVMEPHDENVTHNNTSINKTSNNNPLKPPTDSRRAKSQPKHKPERFERFWEYYRTHARGENRQGAIRAWDRLKPTDELIDIMAAALARQVKREDWQKGVGIPYASTWLNNARWEDDTGPGRGDMPGEVDARGGLEAW